MTVSVLSDVLLSLPSVVSAAALSVEAALASAVEESLSELLLEQPTRDRAIMAAIKRANVLFFMFFTSFFGIFSFFHI
jgi:hypothetical protein